MRLVIAGGGGFRVPLVHRALLADRDRLIDEVVLYDVDGARLRLIADVLAELAHGHPDPPRVAVSTDLREALTGADFVFAAVRPGGLAARALDEGIPLRHGVLGQETVGLGGILYALRSIPAMRAIATAAAEVCPGAWFINFTNPAGMVTEALRPILGDRVIGICDSPAALVRRVLRVLRLDGAEVSIDYVGLNHLGWLRRVRTGSVDRLPDLLRDPARLAAFEEGQLFGPDLLRALGSVPNEYLHYFYFGADVVEQLAGTTTRAEFLRHQQDGFYAGSGAPLGRWTTTLDERNRTYMAGSREAAGVGERDPADVEGGGYEQIALETMRAIATDAGSTLVLDVANGPTYPDLDADAVIEVPARVDARGATPLAAHGPLTDHQAGLMRTVKAVERATIIAAVEGERDALHAALALHPLSGSYPRATAALAEWLGHFPDLARTFA